MSEQNFYGAKIQRCNETLLNISQHQNIDNQTNTDLVNVISQNNIISSNDLCLDNNEYFIEVRTILCLQSNLF